MLLKKTGEDYNRLIQTTNIMQLVEITVDNVVLQRAHYDFM